jgi:hypothetical protein
MLEGAAGSGSVGGIWGTSGSGLFAAAEHQIVLQYDGSSWNETALPDGGLYLPDEPLDAMWGTATGSVWALGNYGTIWEGHRGATVTLSPAAPTLTAIGQTVQLTAEARRADNTVINGAPWPGVKYTWVSGDETVVTVDTTGLVTAVGNGTATITATAPGGAAASAAVTVDDAALVAAYRLDGDGPDASGNARHGVVSGAVATADRWGASGMAMQFDGVNDNISVPSDSGFSDGTLTAVTMIAWVRTSDAMGHFIRKGTPSQYKHALAVASGRPLVVAYTLGGGDHLNVQAASTITDDQWHLVAATIVDGVEARVYVDGVLAAPDDTPTSAWGKGGSGSLYLGGDAANPGDYFVGDLDHVRILRRALSEVEIGALYSAERPPP